VVIESLTASSNAIRFKISVVFFPTCVAKIFDGHSIRTSLIFVSIMLLNTFGY
jgi:uncharacterized membrane protein YgaE (UPF0421/DUF939 family)